ncbi:unnamed protein product, partial [Heterotrigona itama]
KIHVQKTFFIYAMKCTKWQGKPVPLKRCSNVAREFSMKEFKTSRWNERK